MARGMSAWRLILRFLKRFIEDFYCEASGVNSVTGIIAH